MFGLAILFSRFFSIQTPNRVFKVINLYLEETNEETLQTHVTMELIPNTNLKLRFR
jgi:hypothetical protein